MVQFALDIKQLINKGDIEQRLLDMLVWLARI